MMKHLAAVVVLVCIGTVPTFGAFGTKTEWDVRTTGSDANGGGFDPGVASPGTDYSQQDAAQTSYTDIVVGGTTTQGTSVLNPFSSTSPGNIVNITSGTGCTVQRAEVLSVSGATATFDKSLGTAASVCTAALGGSLLTNLRAIAVAGTATFNAAFGNRIHIKAGTYAITTALIPDASFGNLFFIGYQTTHNDGGTKPLITTATNSAHIFTIADGTNWLIFDNLSLSSTAGTTRGAGIEHIGGGGQPNIWVTRCVLDGFRFPINADNFNFNLFNLLVIENTEIKNASTLGGGTNPGIGVFSVGNTVIYNSYIHNSAGVAGIKITQGYLRMYNTIVDSNTSDGVIYTVTNGAFEALHCNFTNNGDDGADLSASGAYNPAGTSRSTNFLFQNNIFYGNTGYGLNWFTFFVPIPSLRNNAFGSNTAGARNNIAAGLNDVTLTAGPFLGATNFGLNSTAGGGAALKVVGFPGAFAGGNSTGYLDIGAIQTSGAPGAGGAYNAAFTQ